MEWLASLNDVDGKEVRAVLHQINRGQLLDLERFGRGEGILALATVEELDVYTYLVAGSVGEFWTRICFAHLGNFSDRAKSEMEELGMRYGKALQLINILRDAGSDLKQGRCYLPMQELSALSVSPEKILEEPEKVEPVFARWLTAANAGLDAGVDYSCAIENARVRCASVLPALIGARTLVLLRTAGSSALKSPVKVPRSEIQSMMIWAATTFASPRAIRKKYDQLSRVE
jgi:farnesyl-diphosphate farnesyltransferase